MSDMSGGSDATNINDNSPSIPESTWVEAGSALLGTVTNTVVDYLGAALTSITASATEPDSNNNNAKTYSTTDYEPDTGPFALSDTISFLFTVEGAILVISNLALIPAIDRAIRYKLYPEATILGTMATVSSVYHFCQAGIFCAFPFDVLQVLDHIMVYVMMSWITFYFLDLELQQRICLLVMLQALLIPSLMTYMHKWFLSLILIGSLVAVSIVIIVFYLRRFPKYDKWDLLFCIFFTGGGSFFFIYAGDPGDPKYPISHAIWHVMSMIAVFFVIELKDGKNWISKVMRKYMKKKRRKRTKTVYLDEEGEGGDDTIKSLQSVAVLDGENYREEYHYNSSNHTSSNKSPYQTSKKAHNKLKTTSYDSILDERNSESVNAKQRKKKSEKRTAESPSSSTKNSKRSSRSRKLSDDESIDKDLSRLASFFHSGILEFSFERRGPYTGKKINA